jgi:hypothetical protein
VGSPHGGRRVPPRAPELRRVVAGGGRDEEVWGTGVGAGVGGCDRARAESTGSAC